MSTIKIKKIKKNYGNNKGVFDVNLEIKQGEVFGFLGPNGAGKTTTIRHLMGFIKPDSGICTINDINCFKDSALIQSTVGYIPGEISFIDDMTGIEFIKFIADYKNLKDLSKAQYLIELFDLDPNGKINKMSKGMKQKLGIVVAFMHDPDILILDEPTSGLDPLMQNIFVKYINEEKKKGKTILMSSHLFEEVEKTCDKVAIIKNGRIATIDTIANLKKNQSKKFTITFNNKKDIEKFKKENIKIVDIFEKRITLIIQNNLKLFFSLLNKYDIVDIYEETQGIEDIFLDYYGGNKND